MIIVSKKFQFDDIATRVDWINDSRINRSMFFNLPATINDTEKWYRNNINNTSRIDFSFFDDRENLIAMGGFTAISEEHKNAEFYVMVNPEMHGFGIGKVVSLWMYNYGFAILQLNKIYLYTDDNNIAAYSIYEKAGFVLEGILREHKSRNGEFQNRRFYGLLRSEWVGLPWCKNIIDNEIEVDR